jgi:peptidoglycan recognition protein
MKFLLALCLGLASFSLINCQCPTIVTRATWGAQPPQGVIPVLTQRPAPYVIVHQTGPISNFCTNANACRQEMRTVQSHQMDFYGYPDIAYSFTIGEDLLVYTARGWVAQGQSLGAFSNQAVNIGYIGNFDGRQPSLRSRELLDTLIQCGITAGHLASNVRVIASCQVQSTQCAANSIHSWIRSHPRFVENPTPFSSGY